MPLIIPAKLIEKYGLVQIQKFTPLTLQQFNDRKKAYKDHNMRIGGRDLSMEPTVVYFDRDDVLTVLRDDPTYLTFMFACAGPPKHDGLRVILCGMNTPGILIPNAKIFEGYEKGGSSKESDKDKLRMGRDQFESRLARYGDAHNWRGVKNNIKENDPAPDPLIDIILKEKDINRIAVYLALVPADPSSKDVYDRYDHYGVMVALSEDDFHDLVPTASSSSDYQVYDNGTQCCQ